MQTISQIRAMLDERGLTPKHRLGQNFLHDKNQLTKLVAAADITPGDVVLEVGPGTGTLTEALLEAGAEVIACELDRDLADLLADRLYEYTAGAMGKADASSGLPEKIETVEIHTGKPAAPEDGSAGVPMAPPVGSPCLTPGATDSDRRESSVSSDREEDTDESLRSLSVAPSEVGNRFTLIRGDCLATGRTVNPAIVAAIDGREFKLIANLPFQIASPLMVALLIDHPNCAAQFITIQKEVADRLMAKPSTKAYGPLSIIVQAFAEVKRIAVLKPTCFWPQPKVDSAMVSLFPSFLGRGIGGGGEPSNDDPLSTPDSRRAFARFVTEIFMKRRKQLGTIFGRAPGKWESLPRDITPDLRPETLAIEQVIELWQVMREDA